VKKGLLLLILPLMAQAEDSQYCFTQSDKKEEFEKCEKGDILVIRSDSIAARVCDIETIKMGSTAVICIYRGTIRERRKE